MGRFDALKTYMDETIKKLELSGIDCIVYQNHKQIFRHAAGYMDIENKLPMEPRSFFNIYSATKVITCVAAMQLYEKGHFLFEQPIYEYLPEFKDMRVKSGTFVIKPAQNHIKIVDLFTMTAGLSYERETPSLLELVKSTNGKYNTRQFVQSLAKEPLMFEPGESFNYSFCHEVLGALIEVLSGETLGEYLKRNIFEPLGMEDSYFELPEEKKNRLAPQYHYNSEKKAVTRISSDNLARAGTGLQSGGGGLIMTGDDYILFSDALACGGVGHNGARILSKPAIDIIATGRLKGRQLEEYYKMMPTPGRNYGLGVATMHDPSASFSLMPVGSFGWGGLGGVQNWIDPVNNISYYVSQHTIASPVYLFSSQMRNILYSRLT